MEFQEKIDMVILLDLSISHVYGYCRIERFIVAHC